MKKNIFLVFITAIVIAVTALKFANAESNEAKVNNKQEQSVAWYIANPKEAHDQNKECHDNVSIQSTPNFVNSLHALQISFAGGSTGRR